MAWDAGGVDISDVLGRNWGVAGLWETPWLVTKALLLYEIRNPQTANGTKTWCTFEFSSAGPNRCGEQFVPLPRRETPRKSPASIPHGHA